MAYKRVHSNSVEVQIAADPANCWHVHVRITEADGKYFTLSGAKTPTLARAKEVGNTIAGVSHQCNEHCNDWEEITEGRIQGQILRPAESTHDKPNGSWQPERLALETSPE
jgi:hypothetical protein